MAWSISIWAGILTTALRKLCKAMLPTSGRPLKSCHCIMISRCHCINGVANKNQSSRIIAVPLRIEIAPKSNSEMMWRPNAISAAKYSTQQCRELLCWEWLEKKTVLWRRLDLFFMYSTSQSLTDVEFPSIIGFPASYIVCFPAMIVKYSKEFLLPSNAGLALSDLQGRKSIGPCQTFVVFDDPTDCGQRLCSVRGLISAYTVLYLEGFITNNNK